MDPPGPEPGSDTLRMLPKLRKDPIGFFSDMSRKYGGMVRIMIPQQKIYLVSEPEYVQHILQRNQRNFLKGESVDAARPLIGNGLASSDGDFWLRQRRLMQPAFHQKRLKKLVPIMTDTAGEFFQYWEPNIKNGEPLELTSEMMKLTLQVIVKTMFSSDVSEEAETIGQAFVDVMGVINRRSWSNNPLPDWLPTPDNIRLWRALRKLDNQVYDLIEHRRNSGERKDDLLDMLLSARYDETGEGMDDKQLRDEVLTIFFAGHETTALTLTWLWTLLAENTQVEARLRAEVDEVVGLRTPTMEDLPKMQYTRMALDETLRLYPPAWVFVRAVHDEDEIDGYRIPSDAFIILSPYLTQRDPRIWEQPESFDPERFNPETPVERHKFAYYPFGGGPRKCIGQDFALMEAQLILAMMIQRYGIKLLPGQTIEPQFFITLRPKGDVFIKVTDKLNS
jgi:cytochrome P450